MSTASIPTPIRDILTKLEYLAMIEQGTKPCVNNMTFVDSGSWLGAARRLFSGESAKHTVMTIENTVEETIRSLDEYKETEFVALIVNGLDRAKVGINKLKETYADRPEILSKLRVVTTNIEFQLGRNRHLLTGHQSSTRFLISATSSMSTIPSSQASSPEATPTENSTINETPPSKGKKGK